MIIIALLVILTFTLLITQIIKLVKSTSNIKNGEVISNVVSDEKQRELDKEELKFELYKLDMYKEFLDLNESIMSIINRVKEGGTIYGE